MRTHFLHALILFCGNTATEMTNPLASIGAMGYHFGNTVNKEDLRRDIPPMSKWENIDAFFVAVSEYDARVKKV